MVPLELLICGVYCIPFGRFDAITRIHWNNFLHTDIHLQQFTLKPKHGTQYGFDTDHFVGVDEVVDVQ